MGVCGRQLAGIDDRSGQAEIVVRIAGTLVETRGPFVEAMDVV